jgi:hypothetical protein
MLFTESQSRDPPSLKHLPARWLLLKDLIEDFRATFRSIDFHLVPESKIINAQANRLGDSRSVRMYGGLAFHPLLGPDAISFTLLHETGHHLALGCRPPWSPWLACECVADSWAINEGVTLLKNETGRRFVLLTALNELELLIDSLEHWQDSNLDGLPPLEGVCWASSWKTRRTSILAGCPTPSGSFCQE